MEMCRDLITNGVKMNAENLINLKALVKQNQ